MSNSEPHSGQEEAEKRFQELRTNLMKLAPQLAQNRHVRSNPVVDLTEGESLELLRGGKFGVMAWNEYCGAGGKIPDLTMVNLEGCSLEGVNLIGVSLAGAKLSHADLRRADLTSAELIGVELLGADLSEATIVLADLWDAKLNNAKLVGAKLNGSRCRAAKLKNAVLDQAICYEVDFTFAEAPHCSFVSADLTRSRFVSADLAASTFDGAILQDTQFSELTGLPHPPKFLRVGNLQEGYTELTGDDARYYFAGPAIIEVYLTRELSDQELGSFRFHLGELRASAIAEGIHLVGERYEAGGTVLRFQGQNYDAVYAALPDLLAPFRTIQSIDWKKLLEAIPKKDRPEAITALVNAESRLKAGRWRIASRLAEAFEGFADARVVKLAEGSKKGVIITVFTDVEMVERLSRVALPLGSTTAALVFQGPSTHYHGDPQMGDTFNITGNVTGAALGRNASVTADQIITNIRQHLPPSASSADELKVLLTAALKQLADEKLEEEDRKEAEETIGQIEKEMEKPEPNRSRVSRWLDVVESVSAVAGKVIRGAKTIAALFA